MKKVLLFILAGSFLKLSAQDGAIDPQFNPGYGVTANAKAISASALLGNGNILLAGEFSDFSGVSVNNLVRLTSTGAIDESFNIGTGPLDGSDGYVSAVLELPEGKVLLTGDFTEYNGVARNGIVRINEDGSIDETFDPGTGLNYPAKHILRQVDGKLILVGSFFNYNGNFKPYIIRINEDGSVDNTFNTGSGPDDVIFAAALQSDGKILIAGIFDRYDNNPSPRLARINPDGSFDASFAVGSSLNDAPLALAVQEDGQILAGGMFTSYNGHSFNALARLNPDGTYDETFDVGNGFNDGIVEAITVLGDGRIMVGGYFEEYDGNPAYGIVRLNRFGQLDTTFNSGSGITGKAETVYNILVQPDGKLILTGNFAQYNGNPAGCVVRILGDATTDIEEISENNNISVWPNPAGNLVTITQKKAQPVEVYSVTGSLLMRLESAQNISFDTTGLESGIYFLKAGNTVTKLMKN